MCHGGQDCRHRPCWGTVAHSRVRRMCSLVGVVEPCEAFGDPAPPTACGPQAAASLSMGCIIVLKKKKCHTWQAAASSSCVAGLGVELLPGLHGTVHFCHREDRVVHVELHHMLACCQPDLLRQVVPFSLLQLYSSVQHSVVQRIGLLEVLRPALGLVCILCRMTGHTGQQAVWSP
jgi:hypothetical protein